MIAGGCALLEAFAGRARPGGPERWNLLLYSRKGWRRTSTGRPSGEPSRLSPGGAGAGRPEPCALEDAVVLDERIKVGQVERIDAFHAQ